MRFRERDQRILEFIYACDGVVSRAQLHRRFWPGKSLRVVQKRVRLLCSVGYLARPTREQYRRCPIPEPVIWLGWRGILSVAGRSGVAVDPPPDPGVENQLRLLEKELRDAGVRWAREPRWSKLEHDLRVIDFRLKVEESATQLHWVSLEEWIGETVFRADPDTVSYKIRYADGRVSTRKRGVIPDGFFLIADEHQRSQGNAPYARYLLEMDMASHSNHAFARKKVGPYAAYIKSRLYKNRFGANSGRWLVVTTGERRLRNLMRETANTAGPDSALFYFTTQEDVERARNVLADPIWRQVDASEATSLMAIPARGEVKQESMLRLYHP